jgi:hypothetical protein
VSPIGLRGELATAVRAANEAHLFDFARSAPPLPL